MTGGVSEEDDGLRVQRGAAAAQGQRRAPALRPLRFRATQGVHAGAGRLRPRAVETIRRPRPGLPFDEAHGGSGGGPVETMIVAEAFGRALALEPYLATVVLAGGLLRHAGSQTQRDAILPKVAEGSMLLAFAHAERQARYDLADVATSAKREGMGYVIDGQKSLVLNGDAADKLIVSARVSGNRRDRDGLVLFVIEAGATGVTRRD